MQHFFTKLENINNFNNLKNPDNKNIFNIWNIYKLSDKIIVNQISKILRSKIWDKFFVLDWKWEKILCEITLIEKKFLEVKILEKNFLSKEKFFKQNKKINLFFVLPKSKEKFEFILQKWTELWINEFHPITSDFCNAKYSNKIERNRMIIKEASEQSERIFLPELKEFWKFEKIFELKNTKKNNFYFFDSRLFDEKNIWKSWKNKTQFDLIKNSSYWNEVNLIIWPEWGFSEKEIELARKNNCEFLSLGKNILRLETAVICAISRVC